MAIIIKKYSCFYINKHFFFFIFNQKSYIGFFSDHQTFYSEYKCTCFETTFGFQMKKIHLIEKIQKFNDAGCCRKKTILKKK